MFQILLLFIVLGENGNVIYAKHVFDGKIVGGKETTIEEYPYQLSLESKGKHKCGASLIKLNVALTAAHCTYRKLSKHFQIRAGSTLLGTGGKVVKIVSICQHPKYSPSTLDYDVAVLTLDQPLSISISTQTIELQPVNVEILPGTLANVTGWGSLDSGGPSASKLQVVEVPRVSYNNCASAYPKEVITNRMICFGYTDGRKDSCQGDSGGPLVVDGKLVGLVSWGYGCAKPKLPGIYSKIANKEINEHIQQCTTKS